MRQLSGVTAQFASIDKRLSASENLVIFGRLLGLGRAEAKRKSAELLEEFSLTQVVIRPISKFSGGMHRRLDLAVSLIAQPPPIFLDESTSPISWFGTSHRPMRKWGVGPPGAMECLPETAPR